MGHAWLSHVACKIIYCHCVSFLHSDTPLIIVSVSQALHVVSVRQPGKNAAIYI